METVLVGRQTEVVISPERPTVILGERINPTGKKKLAQALLDGDMSAVRELALRQVAQGAQVLDVNVGAAGVDEEVMLARAVEAAAQATGRPISIDSTHETALPAALKVVGGRPLINSTNGERASLERVLPLARDYNASVIALTMDEDGIPDTPEGRLRIAERMLESAAGYGLGPERVLIDCLALTVGADHRAGLLALQSIRLVREKLGVNMTMGVSNISHGLPDRELINSLFTSMAIAAGVNCPIVDPARARGVAAAADLLSGRDEWAQNYLAVYRELHPEA